MNSSPRIAVVGVGNWLIAHDRIGPQVLNKLRGRYNDGVAIHEVGVGLGLLRVMAGQDLMFIVDAAMMGRKPGEIILRTAETITDMTTISPVVSGHQIGPLESFALACLVTPDVVPKKNIFILIETEGLAQANEEQVCREVVAIIDREINDCRTHEIRRTQCRHQWNMPMA